MEFTISPKKSETRRRNPLRKISRKRIGRGSYGCGYIPALPCIPGENITQKITKTSLKWDLMKEKENYDKINSIDPKYRYHLPYTSYCPVTREAIDIITSHDNDKNCAIPNRNPSRPTHMLNIWNGGLSLYDYIEKAGKNGEVTHGNIYDFWYCSHNLILFLAELKLGGLYHNDLKPENVVFDYLHTLKLSKENRIKVIDFGLVGVNPYGGFEYFAHPPESLLYTLGDTPRIYTELQKDDSFNPYSFQPTDPAVNNLVILP